MAKSSESQKLNKAPKTILDPPDAHLEMSIDNDQEAPSVEQPSTTEPKWIPVEELADYYAKHKPIGRKYPVRPQLDFDNLYIDESRDDAVDSDMEFETSKKAVKPGRKSVGKSTAKSRSKVEVIADSVVQSTATTPTKGNGKSKMSKEGSIEEVEESSAKEETTEDHQVKEYNTEKYKSCDTCTWARVRCVPGKKTNNDGDKICLKCEERGRECHFSIEGQRPAKPS
jgi:hypothetical protein